MCLSGFGQEEVSMIKTETMELCRRSGTQFTNLVRLRLPLRVAIELLSGRVVQLCRFIAENDLQTPAMESTKALTLKTILSSLGLNEAVRDLMGTEMRASGDLAQQSANAPTQEINMEYSQTQQIPQPQGPVAGETVTERLAKRRNSDHDQSFMDNLQKWDSYGSWVPEPADPPLPLDISPSAAIQHLSPTKPSDDTTTADDASPKPQDSTQTIGYDGNNNEVLVDELSRHVGTLTISATGHTRLCGPSSIGPLEGLDAKHRPSSQSAGYQSSLDRRRNNTEAPEELQDYLVDLYFARENPTSDIVDKDLFMSAKAKSRNGEDTAYHSDALYNAMYDAVFLRSVSLRLIQTQVRNRSCIRVSLPPDFCNISKVTG